MLGVFRNRRSWIIGGLVAVAVAVLALPDGVAERAGAQAPEVHYKCYQPTVSGAPPGTVVNLETPFGTETDIAVGEAVELCAPAKKDGVGPELTDPHLRCYDIVGDAPDVAVKARTQFGDEVFAPVGPGQNVGPAQKLCVPVTKAESPGTPSPPLPTDPHYKCYAVDGHDPVATVDLETQFGVEPGVDVGKAELLCLPALKTVVSGPGENGGGLDDPALVCYTITGPAPGIAPHNLLSQFGQQSDVEFAAPSRLCVEVLSPAVGGIAEVPALAEITGEGAAAPSETGGWSAGAYAALAGGLAAAVVALGGGAWYARRRFSRD